MAKRTHKRRQSKVWISMGAFAIVVAALIGFTSPAWSQDGGSPKVIQLEEEVIKGRIQKPEAFYILQHASLNYERLDPKESFIPEMVESVEEEPF